ncbi:uncharacterized protein LOC135497266 [Lineus longissimus]|uniref:uncharacterized protein LOC135497266 n=1 Tax=Lineus longissimus TaxID=88925 RepID=UPI00315C6DAA
MPRRRWTPQVTGEAKRRRNRLNQQERRRQPQQQQQEPQRFIARQFPSQIETFRLGPMSETCKDCAALRFSSENFNCCHNGKVSLPPLPPYPPELQNLFMANDAQSKNFMENIRQYNSSVSFASFGGHVVRPSGRGPYTFRLHGQLYHRAGSLHPPDDTPHTYSQLYILEASQAIEGRLQQPPNANCRQDVMATLTTTLDAINPYAAAYRHMHELEEEQTLAAQRNNTPIPTVTMNIMRGHDQRRYNNPTRMDEVAAVFVSPDGAPPANRDVLIYPKDHNPSKISYLSGNIDPMVYPLYFPRGALGWYPGMQHTAERATDRYCKISCLQFYAHRLAVRAGFNAIFYGAKLFQQYVVDAYVRTESTRIGWILQNQKQLRVEMYQGLMDHINNQAAEENRAPGKIVVLPSSFQGSPRCMQQNFQDAMAIVSKYGRPDLFLTFTCNPKCKDIKDALLPNQQPHDRPDIVSRVFKLHLKELLHDIRNNHVLGIPIAYVYVIEFQKQGLPHCHLLIILSEESKLKEPADIDSLISAEIPDPDLQPDLFNIIKTSMVHGPCGALNYASPCMVDGSCSKDYPKSFQEQTALAVNGYPLYQRRDNGRTIIIGNKEIDNRWIVPYNPYLSKKYNAHINIEACTSIKSVKYLFKYVYKGHDCANVRLTQTNELTHDEVNTFIDTRYVSAPEAFWRLSEFKLHEQSHSVYRLAIHLPQQQPVYFQRGAHEEAAQAAQEKDTMLTAYFRVNSNQPTPYLYTEFPLHYVWNKTKKIWTQRKQGGDKVLPRIYSVSPKDSEK